MLPHICLPNTAPQLPNGCHSPWQSCLDWRWQECAHCLGASPGHGFWRGGLLDTPLLCWVSAIGSALSVVHSGSVYMELTVSCVLSRDKTILQDTIFILGKLHFLFRANKTVIGKDFSSSPSRRLHIWAYETNFFPSSLRHGNKRRWVHLPIVLWSAIPAPLPHNHPRRGAVTSQQSNPEGKPPIWKWPST